jgi:ribosomal protein S18 acetylase RimI-like enzyme
MVGTVPAGFLACDIATRIAGPRRALHVTMTILHMAVDPRRRLEGVGRFLIDAVAGSLASNEGRPTHPAGRVRVRAVVPEGWLDAQLFLRAIGFRAPVENAVRRAPFDAHDGDGYVMVRDHHWGRADPASDGVPDSGVVAA